MRYAVATEIVWPPPSRAWARAGGDVLTLRADVEHAGDIADFVDGALRRWGRIDGIVHNAGRSAAGPLESKDDAVWEGDLQLKLMGAVRLTRMALPSLRQSKGAVVYTLAMAAKAPGAASEPSSVSRAAGMALMKSLSKELGPDGIRVNAILIGLIESGQWVRAAAAAGMELPVVLRAHGGRRDHSHRTRGPGGGIRRPGVLLALGAGVVPHGHRHQSRRRALAGRVAVASSLGGPLRFAACDPEEPPASALLIEMEDELNALYWTSSRLDLPRVQADELRPPGGVYLVAWQGEQAVAGGAVRRMDAEAGRSSVCSYARPPAPAAWPQGSSEALEARARSLGYHRVRLDTGPKQVHAISLYRRAGYVPIDPYNDNPFASFWGEKELTPGLGSPPEPFVD